MRARLLKIGRRRGGKIGKGVKGSMAGFV